MHVSARDVKSGKEATTEIIRKENLAVRSIDEGDDDADVMLMPVADAPAERHAPAAAPARQQAREIDMEESVVPVAVCDRCGAPLNARHQCPACESQKPAPRAAQPAVKPAPAPPAVKAAPPVKPAPAVKPAPPAAPDAQSRPAAPGKPAAPARSAQPAPVPKPRPVPSVKPVPVSRPGEQAAPAVQPAPTPRPARGTPKPDIDDGEIIELPIKKKTVPPKGNAPSNPGPAKSGEDEFWSMTEK